MTVSWILCYSIRLQTERQEFVLDRLWCRLVGVSMRADGEMDGQIDLSGCREKSIGAHMLQSSSHRRHGFGINGTTDSGSGRATTTATLMVGTLGSQIRGAEEAGVASAYVLPNQTIVRG